MKTLLLISILALATVASAQNILRVNNIPGINAPYNTIQAAVAAASAGDIILVEGSPTTYDVGAFNLTKKLTIRGPGFFLNENITVQASLNPATITSTSFYFSPGSDGSVITGLSFTGQVDVKTSNITISNNYYVNNLCSPTISLSNTSSQSNLLISGNYIYMPNNCTPILMSGAQTFTNVIVSNNYIVSIGTAITWGASTFGVIKNNILGAVVYSPNCDIYNNIFIPAVPNSIGNTTNSTIHNNVFYEPSQANADGTNIFNATAANIFIGLTGNTTDTQWKLKAGAVAIGAGASGEDCGIYGGITPYKISGVGSGLPTINNVFVPATVNQNGTLNVKVSAKVN